VEPPYGRKFYVRTVVTLLNIHVVELFSVRLQPHFLFGWIKIHLNQPTDYSQAVLVSIFGSFPQLVILARKYG
jgi:hypothetical protein